VSSANKIRAEQMLRPFYDVNSPVNSHPGGIAKTSNQGIRKEKITSKDKNLWT